MNREGDNQLNDESLTPLMSRRRSAWSTSSGTGLDIEEGCGPTPGSGCASVDEAPGDSISVRVKTSGDEKVYQVSTPLSATVAQVIQRVDLRIDLIELRIVFPRANYSFSYGNGEVGDIWFLFEFNPPRGEGSR